MPISLPRDIIDSVLSFLCGTASIAECALVCRSWLPSARYHLLPPPKVLRLDQIKIAEFLRLIDLPESTLSLVTFKTLELVQNTVTIYWNDPPRGDEWRSEVAVQDLLARDLISFLSVTSLSMGWIDWRTLSPRAITSLHSNFTSVKELELEGISFTLPEFFRLIAALTALEKITIGSGVPFDAASSTIDTVQMSHPSLCHLAFSDPHNGWLIHLFARAIRYTSGITSASVKTYYNSEELEACGELLETAGMNLRVLKLQVCSAPSPGADSVFSQLLALPHNTNLQEIDIGPVDESTIMLLLQGLKMHTKPKLSRLRLGLKGTYDLMRWEGGPMVDEVLSGMTLKDPKLTVDLPGLQHWWHYETERPEALKAVEKNYLEKSFEKLKNMLPRMTQCWTLEVGIPLKAMYLHATPLEMKVSNTNGT